MEPIEKGKLHDEIESATVVFLDTREEKHLEVKPNSTCHFLSRFNVGDDEIQLRIDWSDIDKNGHPVLDADFYDKKNMRKRELTGVRKSSHHTNAMEGQGRQYCWEFRDVARPFRVNVVWLAKASLKTSTTLTVSSSATKSNEGKS